MEVILENPITPAQATDTAEALAGRYGVYDSISEYRLFPVLGKTTEEVRRSIINLWLENGALPAGADPGERARQALFVVANADGKIVAVSTVYVSDLQHTGMENPPPDKFYCYRMFINRQDRVGHLAKTMVKSAYDYLKDYAAADKPKGIVAIAQNAKLMRVSLQRAFEGIGWGMTGKDNLGNIIYRRDF